LAPNSKIFLQKIKLHSCFSRMSKSSVLFVFTLKFIQ
jgi:hypothetical protein